MNVLKFFRIHLGLTQKRLAKRTKKVTAHTISMAECGRYILRTDEAEALGQALGVDPARLLTHVSAAPLGDSAEYLDAQREKVSAD